jgi:molybdopterin converting factor small subunit
VSGGAGISVKLFAGLAESRGWRERRITHVPGMTVADVWRGQTGEDALPPRVLCAVNMDYCAADTVLAPGDEVGFFPPVTGGAT